MLHQETKYEGEGPAEKWKSASWGGAFVLDMAVEHNMMDISITIFLPHRFWIWGAQTVEFLVAYWVPV
uniref:Uncharacterized protein n=1 Tax=Aegilops tauschii subsp. strangulata TaxID=200361 RepID=A0A453HZE6_AEGTS